jgi:membrane protein YqaA with SNARE-associated domain
MEVGMKDYLRKNSFTIILVAFLSAILYCIPSQIKVSLISKATISPRLFPYVAAISALVCCILSLLLEAFSMMEKQKKGISEQEKDSNVSTLRIFMCIALLFAWYLTLKKIGFIISTCVVVFVLSYMLGNRNKAVLVAFPIIFTLAIYVVFRLLLHVNLPEILF